MRETDTEGSTVIEKEIKTIQDYLMAILPYQQRMFAQVHRFGTERPALLFRGKKAKQSLCAKIAGLVAANKITSQIRFERERLAILRRRLNVSNKYNEWDLVALAQHHGVATRFLDWTSNSLTALWFALGSGSTPYSESGKSEVYLLETTKSDFDILDDEKSPIPKCRGSRTVIFTPQLIDSRIIAQDSYLMRQVYEHQLDNTDVPLKILPVDANPTFKGRVYRIPITEDKQTRSMLLGELARYGYEHNRILSDGNDWETIKKECDDLADHFRKGNSK